MSTSAPVPPHGRELAGWGTRVAALVIDSLLIGAVLIAVIVLAGGASEHTTKVIAYVVGIPLGLLYAPLLMMRPGARNGQTLGRQAMQIRVVREDGAEMDLRRGFLRDFVGRQLLIGLTWGLYALFDYLWPLFDERRQALHDKIASTRVVRVPAGAAVGTSFGSRSTGRESFAPGRWRPARRPGPPRVPPPPPRPRDEDEPVRGWLPPAPPPRG